MTTPQSPNLHSSRKEDFVVFALDARGMFTMCEGGGVPAFSRGGLAMVGTSIYDSNVGWLCTAFRRALTVGPMVATGEVAGCYCSVRFFPLRDGGATATHVLGTAVDLAATTQEEPSAKVLLDSVVDHIPNMIFIKDARDLRFVHFNKAGERLLGYSRWDLLGKNDHDLFPPDEADFFVRKDREVLTSGIMLDIYEEPLHTKTGEVRFLHTKKIPLYTPDGRPAYIVGISEDITEYKRLQAERVALLLKEQEARLEAQQALLLKAQEQEGRLEAERLNKLKDEFLATLSHELRTPLSAILGWSQLLLAGDLDVATAQQAIQTIERNARAETQLVDDLLDVSRIITGNMHLDVQLVDLATITEAAAEALRLAAQSKHVGLQLHLGRASALVHGDARRLQQVAWNLLSNAIKFTASGGHIDVHLVPDGAQLKLSVADNGIGIRAEFLPHVFERFRQADSTLTRNFGGLGLGLAIVRELIELHGGAVEAASAGSGQGATFTVRLPAASAPRLDAGGSGTGASLPSSS